MKSPDVVTTLRDTDNDVTYHVYAFRALTRDELIFAVRYHLSLRKKKPKRGEEIRITSLSYR